MVPIENDPKNFPPHIAKLKIPPAWTNRHISEDPNQPLQAEGYDAKGVLQPRYSDELVALADQAKFEKMSRMDEDYPVMAAKIKEDQKSGDPRLKDAADCMALISKMALRPGSDKNMGTSEDTFGATNLRAKHVIISPEGKVSLVFTGKHEVHLNFPVNDPDLAKMLTERKHEDQEEKLFPTLNEVKMLAYSHTLDGGHYKTKDFRTFAAANMAMEFQSIRRTVANAVSKMLGNTPAVALSSYIPPSVFEGVKPNDDQ